MLYFNPLWRELFWISVAASALLEIWIFSRDLRAASGQKQDRGSVFVVIFSIWLAIWTFFYLPIYFRFARIYPLSLALFACGIAMIWAGMALRLWSVLTLGRFSALRCLC